MGVKTIPTTDSGPGSDAAKKAAKEKAARDRAAKKKAKLKEKAKKNKGCQQKKGTSKKNRDKVNEKKNGEPPKCANPSCGLTAKESALNRIKALQKEKPVDTDRIDRWRRRAKRGRLEADHKFPSSKIKDSKKFKELEVADPAAARAIMHLQSNMRGLCKSCNAGLGAGSGFQGKNINTMIGNALKKAYS